LLQLVSDQFSIFFGSATAKTNAPGTLNPVRVRHLSSPEFSPTIGLNRYFAFSFCGSSRSMRFLIPARGDLLLKRASLPL